MNMQITSRVSCGRPHVHSVRGSHVLLGALPLELLWRVCEELQAQAASALLLGHTELRLRRAPSPSRSQPRWRKAFRRPTRRERACRYSKR